ncbi:MAG: hypothetical protein ACI9TF_000337 [Paracrocinitomix sp.]
MVERRQADHNHRLVNQTACDLIRRTVGDREKLERIFGFVRYGRRFVAIPLQRRRYVVGYRDGSPP